MLTALSAPVSALPSNSPSLSSLPLLCPSPFDFSLVLRNHALAANGVSAPKVKKTGTTIVGLVYNDGVVLGADTRATEGTIVCDKNCEKIHRISNLIHCCGAGTSADTENTTALVESQLELYKFATGKEPRVITALTRLKQRLFQYQGHVSAALVLGGVDDTGSHLYTVYPHGSTDRLPFATMGSGSLAAMSVFEHKYKDNMDEKAAVEMVAEAVLSGIFNDLGSGSNVDIKIISKTSGCKYLRNYKTPNERLYRRQINKPGYNFPKGSTEWFKETEKIFKHQMVVTTLTKAQADILEEKEKEKEGDTKMS